MSGLGRVVVGLSGGIDSSVAVLLLQKLGYEPVGLTLRLQPCNAESGAQRSCCGSDVAGAAAAVACQMGIRHYLLDCREIFEQRVLRPSWDDFSAGRTPNPCVLCNAVVRFDKLVEFADDLGAVAVATGHYARLEKTAAGGLRLLRGVDPRKDQSYFLHAIPAALLARVIFPLGELTKDQVREIARSKGLLTAERRESQDVCFAGPEGHFAEYLRQHFDGAARAGEIRTPDGKVIARHAGVHRFTIGQRRGLGVALGEPARVSSIDPDSGEVIVTTAAGDLLQQDCTAADCRWIASVPAEGEELLAQIRYQQKARPARVRTVSPGGGLVRVSFVEPVSAVTPGQWLVLYRGDEVVGGGIIEREIKATEKSE